MLSTKYILSAFLLTVSLSVTQAQVDPSETKGDKAYSSLLYADALQYYKKAHSKATSESLTVKIADCFWKLRNYDSAYVWYSALPESATNKFRLAELSANLSKYSEASAMLKSINGYANRAAGFGQTVKMVRDSVQWNVQYLDGINTNYFREFSPVLVDSGLIWTTNQPKTFSVKGIMGWDNMGYNRLLKVTDLNALSPIAIPARNMNNEDDSKGKKRVSKGYVLADVELLSNVSFPPSLIEKVKAIRAISIPVQSTGKVNYNLAHISYNGANNQLYLSANLQQKLKDTVRTVSIASTVLNGAVFGEPKFILDQSLEYSNMHPAVHPNGSLVVFSSNRAGGVGGFDLYYIVKDENGNWSAPVLIKGVNTLGNELFPSFGADGKFYFSSDAQIGLGGLDIYTATLENGAAQHITHLSYPINSSFDDFGVTITKYGSIGYFSSDRLGTDDLYSFEAAKKTIQLAGVVKSEQTKAGKPNVEVTLIQKNEIPEIAKSVASADTARANWGTIEVRKILEKSPDHVVQVVKTDANGQYQFAAQPNRSYVIMANDGVNPVVTSKEFALTVPTGIAGSPNVGNTAASSIIAKVEADLITLKDKIEEPKKPAFEKQQFIVYFSFDKADIRAEYEEVLKKVAALMAANPEVSCSLSGHTDQYGSEKYNDGLSDERVVSVRKYLEGLGVKGEKILTGSYGEKQLIQLIKNKDKAEINRRVEITIKLAN